MCWTEKLRIRCGTLDGKRILAEHRLIGSIPEVQTLAILPNRTQTSPSKLEHTVIYCDGSAIISFKLVIALPSKTPTSSELALPTSYTNKNDTRVMFPIKEIDCYKGFSLLDDQLIFVVMYAFYIC